METSISLYSYLLASIAYAILSLMLWLSRREGSFGVIVIAAAVASAAWAAIIAWGTTQPHPPATLIRLTELIRNGLWVYLLVNTLGAERQFTEKRTLIWVIAALLISIAIIVLPDTPWYDWVDARISWTSLYFITWTAYALCGLVAIEQLYVNSSAGQRWSNKFLCLGLGGVFTYDFVMYADALLFSELNTTLWQARGLINAIAVPLIAIAVARNPVWRLDIHLSRQVVFHTATLLGAGVYLLLMAAAGYFIRYQGGSWGGVMQIFFLCVALVLLLLLLFSGKLRANARIWLSKHFFSYRYDYREEWLNFTHRLSSAPGQEVPQQITQALSGMMDSGAALLWALKPDGSLTLLERWNIPPTQIPDAEALEPVANWCEQTRWVIDVDEYRNNPAMYIDLTLPDTVFQVPKAWLLLPLIQADKLVGLLLMTQSPLHPTVNWEDRDLLRTAAQQAASHLAQYLANAELVEARQFEAFNRLSAYVVHDLKNILAQQSMIVTNARKHKHKPEFVDDVIMTVENSVTRMTKLMTQMRDGMRGNRPSNVNLSKLLRQCIKEHAGSEPVPVFDTASEDITVNADHDQLATVFGHLIQNAQDATDKHGIIRVVLDSVASEARVTIIDSGCGMDETFIRERLFRPFDSTKGLTGMGIGAFESREYIRSLGGDIEVSSTPAEGSEFTIVIPLADNINAAVQSDGGH